MNWEARDVRRIICVDTAIIKNYDRARNGKSGSEPRA